MDTWEEYKKEQEEKPKKIMKKISDIIYSHNRFANTREECDILAQEIFEKLREDGLGYSAPIG